MNITLIHIEVFIYVSINIQTFTMSRICMRRHTNPSILATTIQSLLLLSNYHTYTVLTSLIITRDKSTKLKIQILQERGPATHTFDNVRARRSVLSNRHVIGLALERWCLVIHVLDL